VIIPSTCDHRQVVFIVCVAIVAHVVVVIALALA